MNYPKLSDLICPPVSGQDIPDADEREAWVLLSARLAFLKFGELPQLLILRASRPKPQMMVVPTTLSNETAYLAPTVGRFLAEKTAATQLYVASEAWVVRTTNPDEVRDVQPSDDPRRRECVLVIAEDPHRTPVVRQWQAPITRDAAGKPSLGDWSSPSLYAAVEGRLTYLLPPAAYLTVGKRVPTA